jgi:hypothetical protein
MRERERPRDTRRRIEEIGNKRKNCLPKRKRVLFSLDERERDGITKESSQRFPFFSNPLE